MLLQLARLSDSDMKAVKNMKLIEGSDLRQASEETFSLKFDSDKVNFFTRLFALQESKYWLKLRCNS